MPPLNLRCGLRAHALSRRQCRRGVCGDTDGMRVDTDEITALTRDVRHAVSTPVQADDVRGDAELIGVDAHLTSVGTDLMSVHTVFCVLTRA